MKAMYRRYRPKSLDEVVGQEQVTNVLKKAIQDGKIAHAYLFVGPRGTGKTSVARILAHEINQFKYELEDDYLDIIEIDAASNTGVDNIRDIREKAMIAPSKGKYKVYIIDEVHMLTKQAFNALLKTLEEPPEHVIFIMATTDAYKVPITITSRSQTLTFKLADPSTMFEHLKKIAKEDKIKIDDDALKIVVRRGGGSYRDSLSLLDQVSTLSDELITAETINRALGLPQDESLREILTAYAAGDASRIREKLVELDAVNIKPDIIADNLISLIIEKPENVYLNLLDKLTEVKQASYPNVRLLLALTSSAAINTANFAMPTIKPSTPKPTPAKPVTPTVPSAPAKSTPSKTSEASSAKIDAKPETKNTSIEAKSETESVKIKTQNTDSQPIANTSAPAEAPQEAPTAIQAEPVAQSTPVVTTADFDPDDFQNQLIASLEAKNEAGILRYVRDAQIEIVDQRAIVYAGKKFSKNILEKKRSLISEMLPSDYDLEIKEEYKQNDATLASIAEIMGGGEEVTINE